jgi:hypothetical protein
MNKRDLKADLELFNRATPGPWEFGPIYAGTIAGELDEERDRANRELLNNFREGWPHAIERALKAEEAVQSLLVALKKFEENLSRYVCGGWMCSNDDLHYARQEDRELCAEYCELGKVRKKFDEELVRILGVD